MEAEKAQDLQDELASQGPRRVDSVVPVQVLGPENQKSGYLSCSPMASKLKTQERQNFPSPKPGKIFPN